MVHGLFLLYAAFTLCIMEPKGYYVLGGIEHEVEGLQTRGIDIGQESWHS